MARYTLLDRLFGRGTDPAPQPVAPRQRIARGGPRAEYDGATFGRRAAGWRRTQRDANGELSPAVMAALRGIARDLVRNNPFAARGVATIANNMVGTGITFQVYRDGKIDNALNAKARAHFDTSSCDSGGRHDLYGLQLQAARTIVESGAVIMRRRWRRASDGLPLPMQLQVLEPDYIDPSKHGPLDTAPGSNGGFLVNGVQFNPIGAREGYWLYSGHPGSARPSSLGSTFVRATDVAHVFRADRPEMEHGATWLAPIVLRMKDFADFEDAQLTRQKLASAFVGVVTGEDDGAAIPGIASDEAIDDREPLDFVEPGTFQYLRPGEEVNFSSPPGVDGYADYTKVSLRAIAAGLGVPYEALTGDLSNVNFSSGRMGWLEYQRSLSAWQWTMFIPQFCGAVSAWMIDALEFVGEDVTGVTVRWTPPGREMINPSEEVKASRDAIRAGGKTISQWARERGEDPDTFLAEAISDFKKLDELGLIFDCDPRRVTAVGNPAEAANPATAGPAQGA
ncbi:phage portal protein [Sphingomonas hylomeconis]|uniref:Phage portal protein n=1 Tax=Sphingomonas hylomeconis TaxID=1395958 RepID=A0ABV7SQQ5_9SPHN|nr:phage portal protein [Sphingomonas hylomeconis]